MVENMLDGIEVRLNVDFLKEREKYEALADRIILYRCHRCIF